MENVEQPTPANRLRRQDTIESERRSQVSPKVAFKSTFDRFAWQSKGSTTLLEGDRSVGKPPASILLNFRAGSSKNLLAARDDSDKNGRISNPLRNTLQPNSPDSDVRILIFSP